MSFLKDKVVSLFQNFCINVIKTGRIPQHIAFIMDGNRRYATKVDVDRVSGHNKGFDSLSQTMRWCLSLGVSVVTFYAFSIENFKRTQEEVDCLMDLFREKFQILLNEIDELNKEGIFVNVVGRLSLLPEDLRVLAAKLMLATRHNNKCTLNIAVSYTARDEISRAASYIIDSVRGYELSAEDINEDLVSCALDLQQTELLVRTSGEVRLSDFMMWQISNNTVLYFTKVLWPEITIWTVLAALLHYQRYAPPLKEQNQVTTTQREFLNILERQRWQKIEKILDNLKTDLPSR